MRTYRKERKRLAEIKRLAAAKFSRFGVNKRRELVRLFYEISKREEKKPHIIFKELKRHVANGANFNGVKHPLLKRRFPVSYATDTRPEFYLPQLHLEPEDVASVKKKTFYPKNVFFEKETDRSILFLKMKGRFPKARFMEIVSLKEHQKTLPRFSIADYNRRKNDIYLVRQKTDFFKGCPCTKDVKGCGYKICNLGFGCIFECTYCYLQEYTNAPGIMLPVNLECFFDKFKYREASRARIGTGEFTDSLMLDDITGYSAALIDFFKGKGIRLELKTKSRNIANILKADHTGNIIISWSLNPQNIIDENEFLTSSLDERIDSASQCIDAGYKVGFHFDPIILFGGWKNAYNGVIKKLSERIQEKDVAWISLGTLRFRPETKNIIERRFPGNSILDEELTCGHDSKLRYPLSIRHKLYSEMLAALRKKYKNTALYLCMEDRKMWESLGGFSLRVP